MSPDEIAGVLSRPLTLPCGATLPNRLAKSAMTEQLGDAANRPSEAHARRYLTGGTGSDYAVAPPSHTTTAPVV